MSVKKRVKKTVKKTKEEVLAVNVETNEEEIVEHKIPEGVFILKNPAKGNIDIAFNGRIYKLGSGEERLFEKEVGDFLMERYPFLKKIELTAKAMDTIATVESRVSPLTFARKKRKGTFDPLQDKNDPRIPYYGKGLEDDIL